MIRALDALGKYFNDIEKQKAEQKEKETTEELLNTVKESVAVLTSTVTDFQEVMTNMQMKDDKQEEGDEE